MTTRGSVATGLPARTALAICGGYLFVAGVTAMLAILFVCFGIPRAQAAEAATLAGIPAYLGAALWAFGDHDLRRVAVILVGGGLALRMIAGLLGYVI